MGFWKIIAIDFDGIWRVSYESKRTKGSEEKGHRSED